LARFVFAVMAVTWSLGGGMQVAHAHVGEGHEQHGNDPLSWARYAAEHAAHASATDVNVEPTMPFDCHDDDQVTIDGDTAEPVAVGAALGGPLAAGPGLAGILFQQPGASPSIVMDEDIPGLVEIGEYPDVPEEDLREVTDNIICQCGCSLTVAACELAMPCSVAPRMKYQAALYLDEGFTPEQTLDKFAEDWGEKVLAAPTKEGFNLISWWLPIVGLVLGVGAVAWALVAWKGQAAPAEEMTTDETDADMLSRIEDDVQEGM
jgi:cytochrome c-type biogenesis protein CcmH